MCLLMTSQNKSSVEAYINAKYNNRKNQHTQVLSFQCLLPKLLMPDGALYFFQPLPVQYNSKIASKTKK